MVILPEKLTPFHTSFIEVFGSSHPQILRQKNGGIETYNDTTGAVCDFFTVIRESFDEFVACLNGDTSDQEKVSNAVKFFNNNIDEAVLRRFASNDYNHDFIGLNKTVNVKHLTDFCKRWLVVQLEDSEPEKLIEKYDHPDAVFFIDYKMGHIPVEKVFEIQGHPIIANYLADDLLAFIKREFGYWSVQGGRLLIPPRADKQIQTFLYAPALKDSTHGKKTCSKNGFTGIPHSNNASLAR